MSDYYSVQVRVSYQVQQLAMAMARRNGVTMKAWIEGAIREHAHVEQRKAGLLASPPADRLSSRSF